MPDNNEELENKGAQILGSHQLEHEFTIEYNGKKYDFACKPQGVKSTFNIISRSQQILKQFGLNADDEPLVRDLAYEIATLDASLTKRPPEFRDLLNLPPELDDWNLIHMIYKEVADFLTSFRQPTSSDS